MNNFNRIGLVCALIVAFAWATKATPNEPLAYHLGMAIGVILYMAVLALILALFHYLATRKKSTTINQAALVDDLPLTKPRRYWPLFFNYLTVLSLLVSVFLLVRRYGLI